MYDTDYTMLLRQLESLFETKTHWLANLANMSAFLFGELADLNWLGFYLLEEDELILGPFQGKPACVRIPMGKGVCGTAATKRETIIVSNVHDFPGHIVCDAASKSEIVVPMIAPNGKLLGVLDVDSPVLNRFNDRDAQGLGALVRVLMHACEWSNLE